MNVLPARKKKKERGEEEQIFKLLNATKAKSTKNRKSRKFIGMSNVNLDITTTRIVILISILNIYM